MADTNGLGEIAWVLLWLPAWIVLAKILGLYDRDSRSLRHSTVDDVPLLIVWAVFGTAGLWLLLDVASAAVPSAASAIWVAAMAVASGGVFRVASRRIWRAITPAERTAIIGTRTITRAIRSTLELFPDTHLEVVDERDDPELDSLLREDEWLSSFDRVIVGMARVDEEIGELVRLAQEAGVKINLAPQDHDLLGVGASLTHLAGLALLEYQTPAVSRSTLLVKRCMDLAVSASLLTVLAVPMTVAAVLIKLDSPGSVFFRQWRVGRGRRPFRILKFRSMSADAEAKKDEVRYLNRYAHESGGSPMFKIDDDPRVTRVGAFLRVTCIDELPQLFNVLRGEMSLVGPRPLIQEESRHIDGWASRRFDVKPGMTGLWQVNGASVIDFEDMVRLDFAYLTLCSLRTDVELVLRTIPIVWGRRNRG